MTNLKSLDHTSHDGLIDYYKYLSCPDCKKVEYYCKVHKKEVEKILASAKVAV